MTSDQIGGIVRTIAAAVLGYFALKGGFDNQLVESISGALGTLAVAAWSIFTNRPAKIADPVKTLAGD